MRTLPSHAELPEVSRSHVPRTGRSGFFVLGLIVRSLMYRRPWWSEDKNRMNAAVGAGLDFEPGRSVQASNAYGDPRVLELE